MRVFHTKENGPIYIHDDDFQVLSAIMLGHTIMVNAVKEAKERQLFSSIASIDIVSKDLVAIYVDNSNWSELASICYRKLLMLYPKSEEL